MPALVDLKGKRFGRLQVVSLAPASKKKTFWNCICRCDARVAVRADALVEGKTTSCGCYHRELSTKPRGALSKTGSIEEFERRYIPEPNSGCWLWLAGINPSTGYGRFYIGPHICIYAHKFSYQFFKGAIPKGRMLRHKCDVKSCVNPEHLLIGTALDNSKDAVERGLQAHGESHGMVRLTASAVVEIRNSKLPRVVLATKYKVARAHIGRIQTRQAWKHLP